MAPPTVAAFLLILSHKITQYDKREEKKHSNIYRLGHLLGALGAVSDRCAAIAAESGAESMGLLKLEIRRQFHEGFSPADSVIKKNDKWLADGQPPTLR